MLLPNKGFYSEFEMWMVKFRSDPLRRSHIVLGGNSVIINTSYKLMLTQIIKD